uniref:Uncharacterized protein n=1 Tax=Oryza sativa subsp. japonica TaxID=39947 RepID=Q6KA53_ORYSJ|nr:hypothetical protein [Oryza sativa Japonica Group]
MPVTVGRSPMGQGEVGLGGDGNQGARAAPFRVRRFLFQKSKIAIVSHLSFYGCDAVFPFCPAHCGTALRQSGRAGVPEPDTGGQLPSLSPARLVAALPCQPALTALAPCCCRPAQAVSEAEAAQLQVSNAGRPSTEGITGVERLQVIVLL